MEEFLELTRPTIEDFLKLKDKAKEYDFSNDRANKNYRKLKDMDKFFTSMMVSKKNSFVNKYGKPLDFDGNEECKKFFGSASLKVSKTIGDYEEINDPDSGSELLQKIYRVLWSVKEPPISMKNCIKIQGETLNSVNTTLNKLYEFIENDYQEEKEKRESIKIYDKNQEKTQGISIVFILSKILNEKESDIMKKLLDTDELKTFVNSYHTLGNFMPVPNGCNGPRGSAAVKDYWDLTLYHIYNYYKIEDSDPIEKIIGDLCEQNKENYQEWLDSFGDWPNFVEKNYLEAFVNSKEEGYYPNELWLGHFNQTDAYPKDIDQCIEYFKNASKWISDRGDQMMKELLKKLEERGN